MVTVRKPHACSQLRALARSLRAFGSGRRDGRREPPTTGRKFTPGSSPASGRTPSPAQVFAGEGVGVIPAGSAGLRRERILARTSGWHHRRPFFHRAVHFRRHVETVPTHQLGNVAVVTNSDGDLLAFCDAQQGSGGTAVIADSLDRLPW